MDWPKDEHQVRVWLAERLKPKVLTPSLWQELLDYSRVGDAIESQSKEGFAELEERARSYLRAARGMRLAPPRSGSGRTRMKKLLTDEEIRRAEVYSLLLGSLAAKDVGVSRFRQEVLGDRLLTRTKAQALLASPVPYMMSTDELRQSAIPLLDHRAEVTHARRRTAPDRWVERVTLKLMARRRTRTFNWRVARFIGDGMSLDLPPSLWGAMPFPGVEPFVRETSVFGRLLELSRSLSGHYPWQTWEAVWFVLTNEPPLLPPVQAGMKFWGSQPGAKYRRTVLTLAVEPWLSARSQKRVFRAYQRKMLGARNRELHLKSLELFVFVKAREGRLGRVRLWRDLMGEWNRCHPEWAYGEYNNFSRDYARVQRALLFPKPSVIGPIPLW